MGKRGPKPVIGEKIEREILEILKTGPTTKMKLRDEVIKRLNVGEKTVRMTLDKMVKEGKLREIKRGKEKIIEINRQMIEEEIVRKYLEFLKSDDVHLRNIAIKFFFYKTNRIHDKYKIEIKSFVLEELNKNFDKDLLSLLINLGLSEKEIEEIITKHIEKIPAFLIFEICKLYPKDELLLIFFEKAYEEYEKEKERAYKNLYYGFSKFMRVTLVENTIIEKFIDFQLQKKTKLEIVEELSELLKKAKNEKQKNGILKALEYLTYLV